jgi:hypothetical protein
MVVYILDSNFFIEAHRVSYPVDVAYSFWNKVKQLAENGIIISIIIYIKLLVVDESAPQNK